MLGKIRLSVGFSGAPETMTNHSLPTGSISPWVFKICYLDWLYPPSVQQSHSCFLSCRSLQFSLLPGRTHFSCVSPQVFPFLFCKHYKIWQKPVDLVGSLHIQFPSMKTCQRRWMIGRRGERGSGISMLAARHDDDDESSSKWSKSFSPHFHHTCLSSSIGFPVVSIFLAFKRVEQWAKRIFTSLGVQGWLNVRI